MSWADLWRQLFVLSWRPRVRLEDRQRMKRLVRELKQEAVRPEDGSNAVGESSSRSPDRSNAK